MQPRWRFADGTLMNVAAAADAAIAPTRGISEVLLRRIFLVCAAIAAAGILFHLAMLLWADNEFSQPESIVAVQSTMLARDGTLYYPLDRYPYTVCAYTPIFYLLDAGLIKAGVPALKAGRLISFAALLGIFALCWRILMLYTGKRDYAWTGTLLCASTSLLLTWGTTGQVDTLALFFATGAFWCYSRYAIRGDRTLLYTAVFAVAAAFTKQTMLAGPAAIFVLLCFHSWKTALRFGAGTAGFGLTLALALNAITHGAFLTDTVLANLNPFAWEKLNQHWHYMLIAAGQIILVAAIGARTALRRRGKALYLWLGLALLVLAASAPKIGSDSNYQMESTLVLILCAMVALDSLHFFPLLFGKNKTWVTLLQIPLALHLVLNYRITAPFLMMRYARETLFRQQAAALTPYLSGGGRVLSTEIDALVRTRGRMAVEPLIYTLMVHAGRVNPEPVRRDLADRHFSSVVLYQDVSRPADPDPEFPTLPESQLTAIRQNYHLVAHIPGPYLDGVYIYQPTGGIRP